MAEQLGHSTSYTTTIPAARTGTACQTPAGDRGRVVGARPHPTREPPCPTAPPRRTSPSRTPRSSSPRPRRCRPRRPAARRWCPRPTRRRPRSPPPPTPAYDEGGGPSLDCVRNKIEGRYAASLGAAELVEDSAAGRDVEQQ